MKEVTSELVQRRRNLWGKGGWGLLGKGTTGTTAQRHYKEYHLFWFSCWNQRYMLRTLINLEVDHPPPLWRAVPRAVCGIYNWQRINRVFQREKECIRKTAHCRWQTGGRNLHVRLCGKSKTWGTYSYVCGSLCMMFDSQNKNSKTESQEAYSNLTNLSLCYFRFSSGSWVDVLQEKFSFWFDYWHHRFKFIIKTRLLLTSSLLWSFILKMLCY